MEKSLTIGALASRAGVNVQTIRYYQRRELLPVPPLPQGGVRRYPDEIIQRVRFIKRAQHLGFTLEEIARLLELSNGTHCAETREVAEQKITELENKVADLNAMRASLVTLVRTCSRTGKEAGCPIIETLIRTH